jgi:hypothetical protein
MRNDGSSGRRQTLSAILDPMSALPQVQSRESAIDELYVELGQLMARAASKGQGLDAEIEERLERLRCLQQEEARRMRNYFESRLNLAPGAGLSALQEAKRLLAQDETAAPADDPTHT